MASRYVPTTGPSGPQGQDEALFISPIYGRSPLRWPSNQEDVIPESRIGIRPKKGYLRYSFQAIKAILDLPDNCDLRMIRTDNDRESVKFYVESPNLNDVPEGGEIPHVTIGQITGYDE